jgi:hypothetical protein
VAIRLLEGNETGGVGSTNTGSTVLDGFAIHRVRTRSYYFFSIIVQGEGRTMRWRILQGSVQPSQA